MKSTIANRKMRMNLMYIPALCIMAAFVVFPLTRGVYFSLFNWNGYSQHKDFIGLRNYLELFKDKYFVISFLNTLLYGFGSAILQNVLGLAFALFLNKDFPGKTFVRTAIYLPVMISGLLMGYIMYFFLEYDYGILNELTALFGKAPENWLGNGFFARMCILLINSWQFTGISMIIYLAGLQNIPAMYYEAAELDGASSWQEFIHVTFPMLIPAISSAVTLNVIGGLKLNDIIISLTNGGPTLKTHSLSTYISFLYFDSEKAGFASAVGVFLFLFIFIISTLLNRYFRSKELQY